MPTVISSGIGEGGNMLNCSVMLRCVHSGLHPISYNKIYKKNSAEK